MTTTPDMRQEFEAWAHSLCMSVEREPFPSKGYLSVATDYAWVGYSAAWNRRAEHVAAASTDTAPTAGLSGASASHPDHSGDASVRLHNICDALSEQMDGSAFSREEWARIDAENAELRKDAARYRFLRSGALPLDECRAILNDNPHGIDDSVDRAMRARP